LNFIDIIEKSLKTKEIKLQSFLNLSLIAGNLHAFNRFVEDIFPNLTKSLPGNKLVILNPSHYIVKRAISLVFDLPVNCAEGPLKGLSFINADIFWFQLFKDSA